MSLDIKKIIFKMDIEVPDKFSVLNLSGENSIKAYFNFIPNVCSNK